MNSAEQPLLPSEAWTEKRGSIHRQLGKNSNRKTKENSRSTQKEAFTTFSRPNMVYHKSEQQKRVRNGILLHS